MRRLIQFGAFSFILVTFLAPLFECFDRWDALGISNDTEFAVFALVLSLCLVLVVCLLVAAPSLLPNSPLVGAVSQPSGAGLPVGARLLVGIFIPPHLLPLRI
jgi:hypothetical protein